MNNQKTLRCTILAALLVLANAPATISQTTSQPPTTLQQSTAAPPRDERLWRRALAIHRRAVIVDGHNDITGAMVDENYDLGTPSVGRFHTDLQRLEQGGMTGEFLTI